jgi:hypothetical protein
VEALTDYRLPKSLLDVSIFAIFEQPWPFEPKSIALGECLIGNVDDVAEALFVDGSRYKVR